MERSGLNGDYTEFVPGPSSPLARLSLPLTSRPDGIDAGTQHPHKIGRERAAATDAHSGHAAE
jgi:hypothetical protein